MTQQFKTAESPFKSDNTASNMCGVTLMNNQIGVVVAELFGSRAGLGRLISQSADAFNMPELFAGVIVLAVAGIAMTAGFGWLEKRLVPWTKD